MGSDGSMKVMEIKDYVDKLSCACGLIEENCRDGQVIVAIPLGKCFRNKHL